MEGRKLSRAQVYASFKGGFGEGGYLGEDNYVTVEEEILT